MKWIRCTDSFLKVNTSKTYDIENKIAGNYSLTILKQNLFTKNILTNTEEIFNNQFIELKQELEKELHEKLNVKAKIKYFEEILVEYLIIYNVNKSKESLNIKYHNIHFLFNFMSKYTKKITTIHEDCFVMQIIFDEIIAIALDKNYKSKISKKVFLNIFKDIQKELTNPENEQYNLSKVFLIFIFFTTVHTSFSIYLKKNNISMDIDNNIQKLALKTKIDDIYNILIETIEQKNLNINIIFSKDVKPVCDIIFSIYKTVSLKILKNNSIELADQFQYKVTILQTGISIDAYNIFIKECEYFYCNIHKAQMDENKILTELFKNINLDLKNIEKQYEDLEKLYNVYNEFFDVIHKIQNEIQSNIYLESEDKDMCLEKFNHIKTVLLDLNLKNKEINILLLLKQQEEINEKMKKKPNKNMKKYIERLRLKKETIDKKLYSLLESYCGTNNIIIEAKNNISFNETTNSLEVSFEDLLEELRPWDIEQKKINVILNKLLIIKNLNLAQTEEYLNLFQSETYKDFIINKSSQEQKDQFNKVRCLLLKHLNRLNHMNSQTEI